MIAALRKPEPPSAPEISASDKLRAFAAANAIFFSNDAEYRDSASARRTVDELAALIRRSANIVRIVGYTDEAGGQTRNVPLAQLRAERVQRDLIELGIDKNRLVAVGRADALDLSATQGPTSTNRRVEFEIGFDGEMAQ
jgi:outer membrane protein OmpA-like peptidoglycan-associated protein